MHNVDHWANRSAEATERRAERAAKGWGPPVVTATLELINEAHDTCGRCGDPGRVAISYYEEGGTEPNCLHSLDYCGCYSRLVDMALVWCTHCVHQFAPGIVADIARRDDCLSMYQEWNERGDVGSEFTNALWDEVKEHVATIAAKARPLFEATGLNGVTVDLAIADMKNPTFIISVKPVTRATV